LTNLALFLFFKDKLLQVLVAVSFFDQLLDHLDSLILQAQFLIGSEQLLVEFFLQEFFGQGLFLLHVQILSVVVLVFFVENGVVVGLLYIVGRVGVHQVVVAVLRLPEEIHALGLDLASVAFEVVHHQVLEGLYVPLQLVVLEKILVEVCQVHVQAGFLLVANQVVLDVFNEVKVLCQLVVPPFEHKSDEQGGVICLNALDLFFLLHLSLVAFLSHGPFIL
jgi:hypothetical protein